MTTPYERNLIDTMGHHVGHLALINGGTDRRVTRTSIEGDNALWNYGGFVVICVTCDEHLSSKW